MQDFQIRRATNKDSKAICELHVSSIKHFCRNFYNEEQISAWVESKKPENYEDLPKSISLMVAERYSEIVGFGMINFKDRSIDCLYLKPGQSSKGYGHFILSAMEAAATSENISTIWLNSTPNAQHFYEKMGYEHEGKHIFELKSGVKLNCFKMKKNL